MEHNNEAGAFRPPPLSARQKKLRYEAIVEQLALLQSLESTLEELERYCKHHFSFYGIEEDPKEAAIKIKSLMGSYVTYGLR